MVLGVVLVLTVLFFVFFSFGVGIGFGQLKCNEFRYAGKVVKCGSVVQFDNGIRKYLVRISSVKYFNKGFELEYLTNFDNSKWWSKYFYLKNRAIFNEEKNHLIGVSLQKKAVVEFISNNYIYENNLSAKEFKNFLETNFGGKIIGKELILFLMPYSDSKFWLRDRLSELTQIILIK